MLVFACTVGSLYYGPPYVVEDERPRRREDHEIALEGTIVCMCVFFGLRLSFYWLISGAPSVRTGSLNLETRKVLRSRNYNTQKLLLLYVHCNEVGRVDKRNLLCHCMDTDVGVHNTHTPSAPTHRHREKRKANHLTINGLLTRISTRTRHTSRLF